MVTIARGWWSAFEPALLAFTVVVCGSVSLPATAHATVLEGSHLRGTTSSESWTAAAADRDSLDGDTAADAFPAAAVVLTRDDGSGRALVETTFGATPATGSVRLAPRGPPEPIRPAYTQEDFGRDQESDVIVDDDDHDDDDDYDDDDDGREDGGAAHVESHSRGVNCGSSSALTFSEFDALFSFASDNQALRAPPL